MLNLKALNHPVGESGKDILSMVLGPLFALCCSKSYNTLNVFCILLNGCKMTKHQILYEKHRENSFASPLAKK